MFVGYSVHFVKSPINGIIDSVYKYKGEHVEEAERMILLHDENSLWIEANVDESQLRHLELGQRVRAGAHAAGGRTRRSAAALRRVALCWHRGRQRRAAPVESPVPAVLAAPASSAGPAALAAPATAAHKARSRIPELGSLRSLVASGGAPGPCRLLASLCSEGLLLGSSKGHPTSPRGEASPLGCHLGSKRSQRQAHKV